jgi:hypothetical protein
MPSAGGVKIAVEPKVFRISEPVYAPSLFLKNRTVQRFAIDHAEKCNLQYSLCDAEKLLCRQHDHLLLNRHTRI